VGEWKLNQQDNMTSWRGMGDLVVESKLASSETKTWTIKRIELVKFTFTN
jgi:hypothetical protein